MAEAELGGAEGGVGKSGGFTSSHRTACGVGRSRMFQNSSNENMRVMTCG